MYFIQIFYKNLLMTLSVAAACFWFLFSLFLKKKTYFLPSTIATQSVLIFVFFAEKKPSDEEVSQVLSLLVAITALLQFLLLVCIDVYAWQTEKKRKSREEGKALLFTLPDKENLFIRERLNTSLSPKEEQYFSSSDLQMEYMRKCIVKLKGAKLSPADRLAVENYSRIITAYMSAEALSAQELRGVNDTFSALLKMSAKYAV